MDIDFSKAGLYCLLNTPEVQRRLSNLRVENRAVFEKGDSETISRMVAKVVSDEVERFVSYKLESMDDDARKNPLWINEAVKELSERGGLPGDSIPLDDQILKEIKISSDAKNTRRPTTELNECSLIVPDGRTPTLGNEIGLELESANRADWLVSFIKLGAIRAFYPQLQMFLRMQEGREFQCEKE